MACNAYRDNGENIQSPPSTSNLKFDTSLVVETEEFRRGDDGEEDTDSERIERSFRVSGECRTEEFERKSNTESVRVARRKVERYVWSTRCARKDGENVSIRNKTRGGRYNVMVSWRVLRRINVFRISPREVERANVEAFTFTSHFTSSLYIHSRSIAIKPISIRNHLFPTEKFYHSPFHKWTIISAREKKRLLNILASDSRVINSSPRKIGHFCGIQKLHSFHNIY